MAEHTTPKLNKLPFLVGDALLLAVAAWLALQPGPPLNLFHNALLAACVAVGAGLGVWPFVAEFRAAVRFADTHQLTSAVEQIRYLEKVGDQISVATACWQIVQESADKTATASKKIGDQMAAENRHFAEFMEKARDSEVRHLQLEVDKLHRAEGDWLQVVVRMLDHVFALFTAAARSGQPGLIEQLGNFQNACRDATRRIGLTPFEAPPGEPFDEKIHQLTEGTPPAQGAQIDQTVAPGFTYQGQLLRRAVVLLKPLAVAQATPPSGPAEAPVSPDAVDASA